jgi:PAS domain S-box-containing protein
VRRQDQWVGCVLPAFLMTLRRRLLLGVVAGGAIAGAIGVGVALLQSRVDRDQAAHALTLALVEGASQAQALAVEYRVTPDSLVAGRLRAQLATLRTLEQSIPSAAAHQIADWEAVRRDLARVDTVLGALQEMAPMPAAGDLDARERLFTQLIGESRLAVSDAGRLSRVEHAAQERREVDLRRILVAALLALGAVTIALAWWFMRDVSRRLDVLQESGMAWAAGDFSHRAPVDGNDEIGELARGFNTMAEELDRAWRQLRLEVDERRRSAVVLERRARQQTSVAQFGARALGDVLLDALRDYAVATVAEGLGVEFGALTEPLANPADGFSVTATVGWPPTVRGSVLPPGSGSQSGFTVAQGRPVVTDDLASERRFTVPAWTSDLGMHSGISVLVGEAGAVRGVLLGHARGVHSFTEDDLAFMESVASLLAQAMENWETEDARRRSDTKYQDLYDHAPTMYTLVDLATGTITDCNVTTCRALGYTREELVGRSVFDLYTPESLADARMALEALREQGEVTDVELGVRLRNGSVMEVGLSASILTAPDDRTPTARCGWMNIAVRKHRERELERATEELRASREELRQLAFAQERAREVERTQIARELHDELGSALTGLKMDVTWMMGRLPAGADADRARANETLTLINGTVDVVRRMSADLRPGVLDDLGLGSAIRWLAGQFGGRAGLEVRTTGLDDIPGAVTGDRATAVFRILQEALTNVARHAQATAVDIVASMDDDILRLEIRDDGRGYEARPPGGRVSLGILGMQERAAAWDGDVTVEAAARGTVVRLQMPVPTADRPV